MSQKLFKDIRAIIDRYEDEGPPTGVTPAEVYLENNVCPNGFDTCDPSKGKCPEEYMNPIIYAQNGLRCYTKESIARLKPEEVKTSVMGIRALVGEVSKMQDMIHQLQKVPKETRSPEPEQEAGLPEEPKEAGLPEEPKEAGLPEEPEEEKITIPDLAKCYEQKGQENCKTTSYFCHWDEREKKCGRGGILVGFGEGIWHGVRLLQEEKTETAEGDAPPGGVARNPQAERAVLQPAFGRGQEGTRGTDPDLCQREELRGGGRIGDDRRDPRHHRRSSLYPPPPP